MLTSYFSVMSLEKTRILVEIFIGDWIQSWLTNSNPQYGFLLWYYQFVRAETCWSLGFSFIVLSCVVYAWWQSSYVHEGDHYELMGMSFPNDDKEWWYENLLELGTFVTYFLWYAFIDLPYYWKPHRPPGILVITRKTAVMKWLIGERTYNPLAYILSTKYRYRWTLWHVNYLDLTRWTLEEMRSLDKVRGARKTETWNGNRKFFKLGRPTNLWDQTKYFFRVGFPGSMRSTRMVRKLKWKPVPMYLRAPFHYTYIAVKKKSKYVLHVNRFLFFRRKKRIMRYYNKTRRYKSRKAFKRLRWLRRKLGQKAYFKRRKYKRAIRNAIKFLGVNMKRLSFNPRRRNRKYFNRGRIFIRYLRNIRLYRNLLPEQKELQRHILKAGRRRALVYSTRTLLKKKYKYLFTRRRKVQKRFFDIGRPRWHRWYWKKYYYRHKKDDQRSRGAILVNHISNHAQLFPSLFFYACVNGFCWEEDEFDMYEEEFEDWDLEFDPEMGEVNYEDMEMEQDEDLLTLERKPSDTFEALRFSESKQEIRDGDNMSRLADKLNAEDYDNEEDDIVYEEYEDVDTDLVMMGVDYMAAIFEYFTDPVPLAQEKAQLHRTEGYAMPPAWGRLQEASTNSRNLYDRVGAMLYSYYYHNHVDLEDGVSSADYWWDAEPKSWRHDGQPREYLTLAGADWKAFNDWYINEYRLKKKENDPEFYATILEVDAETRKIRPHYHGMAFSRGYYYETKEDQGVYFQNIINSLPENQRELFYEYVEKVNQRAARHEYIADDDYVTFEGGKYNPYSDNFGKANQ